MRSFSSTEGLALKDVPSVFTGPNHLGMLTANLAIEAFLPWPTIVNIPCSDLSGWKCGFIYPNWIVLITIYTRFVIPAPTPQPQHAITTTHVSNSRTFKDQEAMEQGISQLSSFQFIDLIILAKKDQMNTWIWLVVSTTPSLEKY